MGCSIDRGADGGWSVPFGISSCWLVCVRGEMVGMVLEGV